jgi:hypothetical protein
MKRYNILFLFFFSIIFSSCVEDDFSLGSEALSSDFKTIVTDTCTVILSTAQDDSIVTSGLNVAWIGNYRDSYFGKITCSSYMAFSYPGDKSGKIKNSVFDSVMLTMQIDSDYYGDTTQRQTISIYKLNQLIEKDDYGYLYDISTASVDPNPLTTFSFGPRPKRNKKYEIRLPDDFGKDLLTKFLENADEVSDEDHFEDYFKGFAFLPDTSKGNSINSFFIKDSSVCITIYYHVNFGSRTDQEIIICENKDLQFNHVDHDKTGTPIENLLSKGKELVSSKTGNQAYIQNLTGIYAYVSFPYLNLLQQIGDYVELKSAVLYVPPVSNSYEDKTPLADAISVTAVYESGKQVSLGNTEAQTVELYYDYSKFFPITVTSYLDEQMGTVNIDKLKLKLKISRNEVTNDLKRIVIGDMDNSKSKIKVRIKLLVYDGK